MYGEDPSKGTESKFGDYSAFVWLMVSLDGTIYVDADLRLRNTSVIVDDAILIQRAFQPDGFMVEVNQFQSMLADELWRKANAVGTYMPLFACNNTTNKLVRIRGLTQYFARRQIRFKASSRGAQLLLEQLRDFPLADHDDGPDALEMALRIAGELLNGRRHAADFEDTYTLIYT